MWSGRVPGATRTGKISLKDQMRKRIFGGSLLVALNPWSAELQASRVSLLNQIWPSHSPPSALLCPHHPWDKIQIPKDNRALHSKPRSFLGLLLMPRRLLGGSWMCHACSHLWVFAQAEPSVWMPSPTWPIPPYSLRPSSNVHSSMKYFLSPSLLETLNCSICRICESLIFPSLLPCWPLRTLASSIMLGLSGCLNLHPAQRHV